MRGRDEVFRITDARGSATVDRDFRTRRYLWSMAVRTGCFVGAVLVEGWLRWVLICAALVLPYISVVLANKITEERPQSLLPPLIIKDTNELPYGHPDRTNPGG